MNQPPFRFVIPLLLLVALASCHSDNSPSGFLAPTIVEGQWSVTVRESSDSCDNVSVADLPLMLEPTDQGNDVYHVRIDDLALAACWVQPFDRQDDTLNWYGGVTRVSSSCNPGCLVDIESGLSIEFQAGGSFVGVETVRFTPVTPECNVPACQFPCTVPSGHPVLTDFDRRCAFSCETTYTWDGVLGASGASACPP